MKLYLIILLTIVAAIFIASNEIINHSISKKLNTTQKNTISNGQIVSALDSSIWYVFQDKSNNYWFGSNGNGVFRYDGEKMVQFTSKDGLFSNQVRGIQEDKSGNIYITTIGGITKYNGQKFISLKPIESNIWKLESNDLWFSILGEKGENGVYRYDGNKLYHLTFPKHELEDEFNLNFPNSAFSPYEVYTIYKDRKGNMWFGTANFGICRFDGKVLSWLYEDHLTNTPNGGSFGIRSIFEDSKNNFWFCNTRYRYQIESSFTTKNGMNLIDYKRENAMGKLSHNNQVDYPYFFSMIEDSIGNLWMTTYDQGVLQFNGKKIKQYPIKMKETIVNLFSIYQDKQDKIWLGTHNNGVYNFNGKDFEKFNR